MRHETIESKLDNGIKLLFIDVPDSNHFDLAIAINSGYRQASIESTEHYEVPHLLEHMVFDGSRAYPSQEALNDIFSLSGGNYNGMTTPYHNMFVFSNKVKNATEVLSAALDMVFHPLLTQDSFNEEFRVVENELNEYMGDFALNADQYTMQQIIPDMPVSTDTQLARLPAVTYEATVAYHKKYYGTANATVIISCDLKKISRKKMEGHILAATKNAPAQSHYKYPAFDLAGKPDHGTQHVEIGKSIEQSVVSVQYVVAGKPDNMLLQKLSLFTSIASGMKSDSINYKLRKMGLVYGMSLELSVSIESYGIGVVVQSDNNKFFDVFSHTVGLTRNLMNEGIPESAFEKFKMEYMEQFDDAVSTTDGIIGWYVNDYLMNGELLTPKDYKKMVKAISQEEMLKEVRRVISYDNQFATAFSSKGIRVASGVDMLSKGILVDNKNVDEEFILGNTVPLNVKRFLGKELDSYYEKDPNAGLLKRVAYYINSRPLLAWTGIAIECTIGLLLIFTSAAGWLTDDIVYKIIGSFIGVLCIAESCTDIYIRLHRGKTK